MIFPNIQAKLCLYCYKGGLHLLGCVIACSRDHSVCPVDYKAGYVLQTEEASDKLRQVIAPMASHFGNALTPLKSAVSPNWHNIPVLLSRNVVTRSAYPLDMYKQATSSILS